MLLLCGFYFLKAISRIFLHNLYKNILTKYLVYSVFVSQAVLCVFMLFILLPERVDVWILWPPTLPLVSICRDHALGITFPEMDAQKGFLLFPLEIL